MDMYWLVALTVASLFVWMVSRVGRGPKGAAGVVGVSLAAVAASLLLISPSLFLQALLTLLAAVGCLLFGLGSRALTLLAIGAAAASLATVYFAPDSANLDVAALREEFPLVPVSHRLSYEKPAPRPCGFEEVPYRVEPPVEQRMLVFEQRQRNSFRVDRLQWLHSQSAEHFAQARGFGVSRMPVMHRSYLVLPNVSPIPQPADPEYSPDSIRWQFTSAGPKQDAPSAAAMERLHGGSLDDLFNADRLGYVQDRSHVAGFQSHRLTSVPRMDNVSPWRVVRLELVSLLRHKTPVAYVSDDLPQMDQLAGTPTRPLSAFETEALEQLRKKEDVVASDNGERIHMVGSLRAGKDCLECHTARRGELLGALVYELAPIVAGQAMPAAEPQAGSSARATEPTSSEVAAAGR